MLAISHFSSFNLNVNVCSEGLSPSLSFPFPHTYIEMPLCSNWCETRRKKMNIDCVLHACKYLRGRPWTMNTINRTNDVIFHMYVILCIHHNNSGSIATNSRKLLAAVRILLHWKLIKAIQSIHFHSFPGLRLWNLSLGVWSIHELRWNWWWVAKDGEKQKIMTLLEER